MFEVAAFSKMFFFQIAKWLSISIISQASVSQLPPPILFLDGLQIWSTKCWHLSPTNIKHTCVFFLIHGWSKQPQNLWAPFWQNLRIPRTPPANAHAQKNGLFRANSGCMGLFACISYDRCEQKLSREWPVTLQIIKSSTLPSSSASVIICLFFHLKLLSSFSPLALLCKGKRGKHMGIHICSGY